MCMSTVRFTFGRCTRMPWTVPKPTPLTSKWKDVLLATRVRIMPRALRHPLRHCHVADNAGLSRNVELLLASFTHS